ncbi:hypothetical protein [Olleya sp. Bg11-27]|uniref:hypothetical protein n=1 Tax=Olleya sp. Bg11-27 TaxID=2058135 RepID=UPI000C30AC7C|nr:hypothetical protein [Olleya sp. Bg11-27]AUC76723.1 hypothetical protein CW732_13985 [Olleya sp. Bg11-27]
MEQPTKIKNESNINIQDYLSIGYLFLLVLGVVYQTIYYKFLGVNILDYSSVLDVLISPIAVMTSHFILGLAVVLSMLMAYLMVKFIPKYHNWLRKKAKYQSGKNKLKLEKADAKFKKKNSVITMIAFYVFAVFIGLGIGSGHKTKQRVETNDYKITHQLTFDNGSVQDIKMLGKNSLYVFYVIKGAPEVIIAPIEGNIKMIKNLKKNNN